MRRFLLTMILISPIMAMAQITITSADFPANNDVVERVVADTFLQVDPNPTGTNYTWDYSNLTAMAATADTFLPLSATPPAYTFFFLGAANRAVALGGGQDFGQFQLADGYQFYNVTNGGVNDAGFAGSINGIPIPARYDQPDRLFVLPLNFGDDYSSTSAIDISIPNLVDYSRTIDRFTEVDGYGTLYLPNDTFQVLRTKSTIAQVDSISFQGAPFPLGIPQDITEYKWMAKGQKWPVLTITQINIFGAGITTQVQYKGSVTMPVGTQQVAASEWQLYPTLLQNGQPLQLKGETTGPLNVRWINVAGQVVANQSTSSATFQVPNLSAGQYWVQVWDNQQMKVMAVQVQ